MVPKMNPCYTNVMYCTHNLAKMVACITFVSVDNVSSAHFY